MTVLSALLPCEQGVAAYAALYRHADTLIAGGNDRTRGQIMADTLVERLTGQTTAEAVSAEIGLAMTDAALFCGDDEPAELSDYGPIPAALARDLARGGADPARENPTGEVEHARVFLRRLFADPITGIIAQIDRRRRRFGGTLAKLLVYRDQYCRDPYCDASIRHLDHIQAHSIGGSTTEVNGRGLCERGNYVATMPGWKARVVDAIFHTVEITTPTGHTYTSRPPPALGSGRVRRRRRHYPLRI